MPADLGPCRHCGATVERTATRCRECGYEADPKWNEMLQFVLGVYGTLLVATIVFAPLGFVMLWKARMHHRALTRGVVEPECTPDLRERIASVFSVQAPPSRESLSRLSERGGRMPDGSRR